MTNNDFIQAVYTALGYHGYNYKQTNHEMILEYLSEVVRAAETAETEEETLNDLEWELDTLKDEKAELEQQLEKYKDFFDVVFSLESKLTELASRCSSEDSKTINQILGEF